MKCVKKEKNKNGKGGAIVSTIIFILLLPIAIFTFLIMLLYTPFGYAKFKRSEYQKDFPKKYKWLSEPHFDNDVYTLIKRKGLPVEYFKAHGDYELSGYFLYKDALLVFSHEFVFDEERAEWLIEVYDEVDEVARENKQLDETGENSSYYYLSVEETKKAYITLLQRHVPNRKCNEVVFFYKDIELKWVKKQHGEAALEKLQSMPCVVFYDRKGLEKSIKDYIEKKDKE